MIHIYAFFHLTMCIVEYLPLPPALGAEQWPAAQLLQQLPGPAAQGARRPGDGHAEGHGGRGGGPKAARGAEVHPGGGGDLAPWWKGL